MIAKIAAAVVLMTLAGAASASVSQCEVGWLSFCGKNTVVVARAPEIDPASAMAGLTLLAGGLAVLRGRRARKSQE